MSNTRAASVDALLSKPNAFHLRDLVTVQQSAATHEGEPC